MPEYLPLNRLNLDNWCDCSGRKRSIKHYYIDGTDNIEKREFLEDGEVVKTLYYSWIDSSKIDEIRDYPF